MTSAINPAFPISGTTPGPTTASVRSNFSIAQTEISALQAPTDGLSYAQQSGGWVADPRFTDVLIVTNTMPPPLPTPTHVPTHLRIAPLDGVIAAIMVDSWGTSGPTTAVLSFRQAGGTAQFPAQTSLNTSIGRIEMIGRDTSAYGTPGAAMAAFAAEPWSPVAHGAYVNFATTAIGQTGGAVRMQIGALGGIVIGSPAGTGPSTTPGDMGAGTLNVQAGGLFVNGLPAGSGGGGGGMSGPIVFNAPLTGGTITTAGTVGLATPSAQLLGGTGTGFAAVSVGSGLNLSGLGVLTATGASLTIPNANIISGNGSALGSINVSTGLTLSGAFPNQTLTAAGGSGTPGGSPGNVQYNSASTFGGSTGLTLSASAVTGLNVGSDAPGDMYYRNSSGNLTRIPAGSSGNLLQSTGATAPIWAPVATGGGTVTSANANLLAWYAGPTSPQPVVSGLSTISAQAVGSLSINQSPNPAPALFLAGTLLQLVGNDGAGQPNIEMTGFGGSPGLVGRRAGGTSGSLANTTSGASLLALTARGWDSTNLWMPASSTGANLLFQTAEAWTATAHGANITFSTTPIGQLTLGPQVIIGPTTGVTGSTGGLTVGAATAPASPLVTGDLNVAGRILQNGIAIGGGPSLDSTATVTATGATQTTAFQLTAKFSVVATPSVGLGVRLTTPAAGDHCIVRNDGPNALLCYPQDGHSTQINAQGADTSITIGVNSTAYFEFYSATRVVTIP